MNLSDLTKDNKKVMFYSSIELRLNSEEVEKATLINEFIAAANVEFTSRPYTSYQKCLTDLVGFMNLKKDEFEDQFSNPEYKIIALENPLYSERSRKLDADEDAYWQDDMIVSLVLINEVVPEETWIIRSTVRAYEIESDPRFFILEPNETIH